MDDFIIRALLGGIGVATAAGPLGSFIIWKKMAFFGDALSHSAVLGVVAGILLGVNQSISIAIFAFFFSFFIMLMKCHKFLEGDTVLALSAHGALALGMVMFAVYAPNKFNLTNLLFGDILAISYSDILVIYVALCAIICSMVWLWKPLLLATINEDLARVDGVNVKLMSFIFNSMVAFMVALSIKVVGVLLVSSLLIIPAATARIFSKTPEFMAVLASCFGILAIFFGIGLSLKLDTPAGPSIVLALLAVFICLSASAGLFRNKKTYTT